MLRSVKNLSWIGDRGGLHAHGGASQLKHKNESLQQGLQALTGNGPPRPDGSDRFFGMENIVGIRTEPPYGNTCYCNSILQCLYYSKPFRENVVNFPVRGQPPYQAPADSPSSDGSEKPLVRVNTEPLPTTSTSALAAQKARSAVSPGTKDEGKKKMVPAVAIAPAVGGVVENKDSPEYKKKRALEAGPILELDQGNHTAYGMDESLFTALKDLFESIMAHNSKTGVVKPNKFLEILRRENDMFNGQQHQDAHEFLNYVLNEVIENVEAHQKKALRNGTTNVKPLGSAASTTDSSAASMISLASAASAGWINELFQGLLTSETKCLTCENVSRRDEHFLDLSIDLERNSSVTSCLRNFSASEMLCERNKFHCDTCGGLQEAEKRMKLKRLPKVLALHLKRFKYMEQTARFEKLHHRVLYPYHLRLFNTTDDAEDPDQLYELYAVVVHIGGGPYHGHYVAIIKTEDKGWLLFDDEMVEPVSKDYVRNFFGERTGAGVASAYLLFYQQTTLEAVQREEMVESLRAVSPAILPKGNKLEQLAAKLPNGTAHANGVHSHRSGSVDATTEESAVSMHPPLTSPYLKPDMPHDPHRSPAAAAAAEHPIPAVKSKKEREREKKEEKEREKAERKAKAAATAAKSEEKEKEKEKESEGRSSMSRFRNTSRSLRQPGKWLGGGHKEKDKDKEKPPPIPTVVPVPDTLALDAAAAPPQPSSPPMPSAVEAQPLPPPSPEMSASTTNSGLAFKDIAPPPIPPQPPHLKDKSKREEKAEGSGSGRKRSHYHRPSLFGLRKKAQTALGAGE